MEFQYIPTTLKPRKEDKTHGDERTTNATESKMFLNVENMGTNPTNSEKEEPDQRSM
jgi:hypothetical protein